MEETGRGAREPDTRTASREALQAFLAPLQRQVRRVESRAAMERYVAGLLEATGTRSMSALARAVPGRSAQSLQEFLTRTAWDVDVLNRQLTERAEELLPMPGPRTVVVSTVRIPKRGTGSVGADRQSAAGGRTINCQVLVRCCAVDGRFDWPASTELYLPPSWTGDPERRSRAGVPSAIEYRSRAAMAESAVDGLRTRGGAVTIFSEEPDLVAAEGVLSRLREKGLRVLFRLPGDRVADLEHTSASTPLRWHTVHVLHPRGGVRARAYARLPFCFDDGAQVVNGSALIERPVSGFTGRRLAYFEAGLARAPLQDLADVVHHGYVAEASGVEATRLGLRHYEGRTWRGLVAHLALVRAAQLYLQVARIYGAPAGAP